MLASLLGTTQGTHLFTARSRGRRWIGGSGAYGGITFWQVVSATAAVPIRDRGVLRSLDPDSESQAEAVEDPCQAVEVGLVLQGVTKALAREDCKDRAASEAARFLESDAALSDLGDATSARLCNYHSQLYMVPFMKASRLCQLNPTFEKGQGQHEPNHPQPPPAFPCCPRGKSYCNGRTLVLTSRAARAADCKLKARGWLAKTDPRLSHHLATEMSDGRDG